MTTGDIAEVSPAATPVSRRATGISMLCKLPPFVSEPRLLGALLGPIAGLALWWLPVPRQPAPQAAEGSIIQQVQAHLTEFSFDPSPVDSQQAPSAEAALRQVHAAAAVPGTRRLDRDRRSALGPGGGGIEALLIKDVQSRLRDAGFDPGPIDGRFGPRTEAALRRFQATSGLPVTGRIDAETLAAFEHRPRSEGTQASEGRHPSAALDPVKSTLATDSGCRPRG